jgi:hypothetical protein
MDFMNAVSSSSPPAPILNADRSMGIPKCHAGGTGVQHAAGGGGHAEGKTEQLKIVRKPAIMHFML